MTELPQLSEFLPAHSIPELRYFIKGRGGILYLNNIQHSPIIPTQKIQVFESLYTRNLVHKIYYLDGCSGNIVCLVVLHNGLPRIISKCSQCWVSCMLFLIIVIEYLRYNENTDTQKRQLKQLVKYNIIHYLLFKFSFFSCRCSHYNDDIR